MNEKVGEIDDAILAFTLGETAEALRILSQYMKFSLNRSMYGVL